MISNQILQNTIEGLKAIARVEFCVLDVDGKEVASTTDMGNNSRGISILRYMTNSSWSMCWWQEALGKMST